MKLPSPSRYWPWIGLGGGALFGALESAAFYVLGARLSIAGRPADVLLAGFLVLSYGFIGYAAGRLARARARARQDRDTIHQQLDELEKAQRAMIQQEKLAALGRLGAAIAHEVRNPLGVVRAAASMLRESFPHHDDRFRACQFICEETDRLNGLVASLLSLSGPTPLRRKTVDLRDGVERASFLVREEMERRHVEFRRSMPTEPLPVEADPDLLCQVLLSLLLNAAQAAEGGIVELRARAQADRATLEVADSGPGVGVENAPQIFEPFFTTKPRGTGLGLAMALRIVEVHGGRLELVQGRGAGSDGRGACFRVELPSVTYELAGGPAPLVAAGTRQ